MADDWRIQVGDDGDNNRLLNFDPVLWAFAGDVNGFTVLDAGCGAGYLSKKLHDRGAKEGFSYVPRGRRTPCSGAFICHRSLFHL